MTAAFTTKGSSGSTGNTLSAERKRIQKEEGRKKKYLNGINLQVYSIRGHAHDLHERLPIIKIRSLSKLGRVCTDNSRVLDRKANDQSDK